MKTSEMYQGEFCLKKSPWPTTKLKDWPVNQQALHWLQGYLLSVLQQGKCPEAMKKGLAYKEKHLRSELSKEWNRFLDFS